MILRDFLSTINYRITDGYTYQWGCYGPGAHGISSESDDGSVVSCVFDTRTQFVYQVEAWDAVASREYRWIDPAYIKPYKKESRSRGVKFRSSIDDNKFIDLETEDDIKQKATAIANGETYDTRVSVPLELSDEESLMLMKLAHEADMTLNDFVADMLQKEIDRRTT